MKNEKKSQIPQNFVYIPPKTVYNNLVRKPPPKIMDKNSADFFKELNALMKKYDASVHATWDGDLFVYVGDKEFDDILSLDGENPVNLG